jgi:hypothetical protein
VFLFLFQGLAILDPSHQPGVGREQEFKRRHFVQNLLEVRNLRVYISSHCFAGIGELSGLHRFTNTYIRNDNFGINIEVTGSRRLKQTSPRLKQYINKTLHFPVCRLVPLEVRSSLTPPTQGHRTCT